MRTALFWVISQRVVLCNNPEELSSHSNLQFSLYDTLTDHFAITE